MNYEDLKQRLLALPGASAEWLRYTLSRVESGTPIPTSYCLVRRADGGFDVYKGDERGGVTIAKADDGLTPMVFQTEQEACSYIWGEIMWWREFEARRSGA